jgi:hypothetical protein
MARFNDSKAHYESLINLFKYCIGFFSAFAILIGWTIYKDGQDMRAELRARRLEIKDEIKEMKSDISSEKSAMKTERDSIIREMRNTVTIARQDALEEIDKIKIHASLIAESEARLKINEVFDARNLNKFVEEIAEQRIKPQINGLVDKKLAEHEMDEVNKAIAYLKNPGDFNFNIGLSYLQSNPQFTFSEDQITDIIEIIKQTRSDYKYQMMVLLTYRKSPQIIKFYKDEIIYNPTGHIAVSYSPHYLLANNEEMGLVQNFLKKRALDGFDKFSEYLNLIALGEQYNMTFLIWVINDKELVQMLQKNFTEYDVKRLKTYLNQATSKKLTGNQLEASLLYKTFFL